MKRGLETVKHIRSGGASIVYSLLVSLLQSCQPQCRLNLVCVQVEGSRMEFVAEMANSVASQSEHLTLQMTHLSSTADNVQF